MYTTGERYKSYHEEAERIVTDLGPSTWESLTSCTEDKERYCPATLYISGTYVRISHSILKTWHWQDSTVWG